jgi:hypothetical protein
MDIESFRDLARDKNVLLVGNSTEMMNHANAELIDGFDVVVRFGRGIDYGAKQAEAIGTKLDVWVTGAFRADMLKFKTFRDKTKNAAILFNRARLHVSKPVKINENLKDYLNMYEDDEILSIMAQYGIKDSDKDASRLSAGAWTIKFFIEKVKTQKSLTLIGFDFFAKKTNKMRGGDYEPSSWHLPISIGKAETHSHEQEVAIVSAYEKAGLLTWIKLSDLNPAWINDSKYGDF